MNTERTQVSVVIRCYNEEEHIGRLLEGIAQQDHSAEVIVVDSGSTDGTLAVVETFPDVRICTIAPEDFSFGRALNLGCEAASGEILVFASAHVYPMYRDWLTELVAPFADSSVALTYGKQRGARTTKFSEHRIFSRWFPDAEGTEIQDHPFCNNANAAIRRSLWEDHPYDETLTGLEDLDWAQRVMDEGYRVVYQPQATVIHVHEESFPAIYNRYKREAIALRRIFPERSFGFLDFLRFFAGNTLSDLVHAFRQGRLLENIVEIPRFRFSQFWGTFQGHRQTGPVPRELWERFYYPARGHRAETREGSPERLVDYTFVEGESGVS